MKSILTITLLLVTQLLPAQDKINNAKKQALNEGSDTKLFLNLSSGINNPNGFAGIGMDVAVSKSVMIGAGLGLSTWGAKINFKTMYFLKENHIGSAFGASINYNTGNTIIKDPSVLFELSYNVNGQTVRRRAYGTMAAVPSLNIMYGRYWKVGKRSRFFINTGLVAKLGSADINFKDYNTDEPITDQTSLRFVKILSPGGLCFASGFLIRLNK